MPDFQALRPIGTAHATQVSQAGGSDLPSDAKEFIMINRSTPTTLRRVSAAAALAAMFVGAAAPASAKAAAGAAMESSATSATPAAVAPREPSAQTKYCVLDQITGSRLQKKVCKTKKEWRNLGVDIEAK
jgi:hypothetical protein